jgi:uncharacterized membrane protein YfcA
MLEAVAKLGISGGVGALIGLAAVWWVEPTTTEGTVLLILIWVLIFMVLGGIITHFFGTKKNEQNKENSSNAL